MTTLFYLEVGKYTLGLLTSFNPSESIKISIFAEQFFRKMKNVINPVYLTDEKIAELKKSFKEAQPCQHLVLPNFLDDAIATSLYENFPKIEKLNVKRKSINENKSEDYHFDRFHPDFSTLREVVSSPEMYKFMETITGIDGLRTLMIRWVRECTKDRTEVM